MFLFGGRGALAFYDLEESGHSLVAEEKATALHVVI